MTTNEGNGNMKKTATLLCACAAQCLCAGGGQIPQKMRDLWENPVTEARIETGIRANRMGEFYLEFDKPVEDLKIRLDRHEFLFGAYASRSVADGQPAKYPQERVEEYAGLYRRIFNYGTVATVWRRVEPQRGKFRWDYSNDKNIDLSYTSNPTVMQPDAALAFCEKNGITPKGHTFAWPISVSHFMPAWALDLKDPKLVEAAANRNVRNIAERYRDRIKIWDVVNEAADYVDNGAVLYGDYVFKTFKQAERMLPPDDVFLINETTSAWYQYIKDGETGRFYMLAKSLIDRGAKLDGIGLQFHFFSDRAFGDVLEGKTFTPRDMSKALDGYAKLGRQIHVTEITIPTSRGEEAQAYFARQAYRLFFSHPAVEAITWWNVRDGQAAYNEAHLMGGLIRDDLTPKASYRALEQLIAKDWQTSVSCGKPTKSAHFEGFYGMYEASYKFEGKEYRQKVWFGKKSPRTQRLGAVPADWRKRFY